MRLRNAIVLAIAASLLAGACSRLTFIKPNAKRGSYEKTAPDYAVRDSARSKQRIAALDHLALAEQGIREGRFDNAETEARAALKSDPASADAHTLLAVVHDQRGDRVKAGELYGKAALLAPEKGAILNNFGTWLCSNGRAAESLAWFDRALADPSYGQRASALANAGACALDAGQPARVEASLRAALALDPDNIVALAAMADYQYRNARFLDARAFSERRLGAAPATAAALQLASQIEDKLGDKAAAARYVQRLHTEFPQARTAHPRDSSTP